MSGPQYATRRAFMALDADLSARLAYLPALAFSCGTLLLVAQRGERYALPRLQDDAYYYLVIARNIVESGRSEFTSGVLTNGYQPLWMMVIVAAVKILGASVTTLKILDILALFSGFVLFVWLFSIRSFAAALCYTTLLWYVASTFAGNGMESSLLVPGLILFVGAYLSRKPSIERRRGRILFAALALCVGARLDALLLLAPIALIAPVPRTSLRNGVAIFVACAAAYAAFNAIVFESPLPISGIVKSLGGLQLNHVYVAQLARDFELGELLLLRSSVTPYCIALAMFALTFALPQRLALTKLPRRMIYCALAGFGLFAVKLWFFSSWLVWPWYTFPTLLFVLLAFWCIENLVVGGHPTYPRHHLLRAAQLAIGLSMAAFEVEASLAERNDHFGAVTREFIRSHADTLGGRPVAMGDRAGAFAFNYPGRVYQLEGLVNEPSYIDVLHGRKDLRRHLCEVGVEILVSYEEPLGEYTSVDIQALRGRLTSFGGPSVQVDRSDELASFEDPRLFDGHDRRIYAWRLHCAS